MAGPALPQDKGVVVAQVKGVNERLKFTNPDITQFDILKGFIPQRDGILQRINGTKFLQLLQGRQILNMCQTFDRRKNFIVQTDQGVYLYSEDELLNREPITNLTPVVNTEEEDMAKAILIHSVANNVGGGALVATTWTTAPISAILSQKNPDGTAAAFVTALAANAFTLATGGYRFNIRSVVSCTTGAGTPQKALARLYNVTTGLPAWSGLDNEVSMNTQNGVNTLNFQVALGGDLDIAVPTQFRLEHYQNVAGTFGIAENMGFREVYRWIEIIQTHS